MTWPVSQDYNEAVQNPGTSFGDPELRQGKTVLNALGLPMPRSGNFADVYEVVTPATNRKWAVKCFTREVPGLRERYREISDYLRQVNLPFMVDFNYLDEGIRIRGKWYPILKMHWVEGLTLNEFVKSAADKPQTLEPLVQLWTRLARRLREARLAHCDLQHGNVLLVPGRTTKHLGVKLIDYDGMCVPALAQRQSGEVGHPAFQHPQRIREGLYGPEVDRFPHLVIYCALKALIRGGRGLWDRFDNGDNLLFRQKDLEDPGHSPLFQELLRSDDPTMRTLTETLKLAARYPMEQTPLLDELPGVQVATTAAGGRVKQWKASAAAPISWIQETMFAAFTEVKARVPSPGKPKGKTGRRVWWLTGGALALVGLVIGIVLASGREQDETPKKEPAATHPQPRDAFTSAILDSGNPRPAPAPPPDTLHDAILDKANPKPDTGPRTAPPPEPVPTVPEKPEPPKPEPTPALPPQPTPEATGKLLQEPDTAEQELAVAEIKGFYPNAYGKRNPAEMLAAARDMLERTSKFPNDANYRFVLLREARDLAADALDLKVAFQAIDQMAQQYKVDGPKMRADTRARAGRAAAQRPPGAGP